MLGAAIEFFEPSWEGSLNFELLNLELPRFAGVVTPSVKILFGA